VTTIDRSRLAELTAAEQQRFTERHPRSAALHDQAGRSLLAGVPMNWMTRWPGPFPVFLDHAAGGRCTDVDGVEYVDLCLGDTGAMTGHALPVTIDALTAQSGRGITTMLPSEDAVTVGDGLRDRFGLPVWQIAMTATDANRFALRLARHATGRRKVLVFNWCYHGTVDEALNVLDDRGRVVPRPGNTGWAVDPAEFVEIVEFNDLEALGTVLRRGEVAAVLAEPALTNIGIVPPDPGFHEGLRRLTRETGTLLIIDETHTISTGPGGWTRSFGLEPDIFVLGKPVAGGIPCAIFGFTAGIATRMDAARTRAASQGHGHSGMGTTLSANAFAMHAMRANLQSVMTEAAYARMVAGAERLKTGLEEMLRLRGLAWSVTQIGSRCEFQFCAIPPRTGREAEAAFHDDLEKCLHLGLLNRGVMITPFHNMMLVCPETEGADIDRLVSALSDLIDELSHA